jgi:NAD-dependent deacetylase
VKKRKLVVLTGAGISAESGLKTFRDSGGLWEGYNVYDVATHEAWQRNPQLVLEFYNLRRKGVLEAEPNHAHRILAQLEVELDVWIITQNVDNLHERAGSSRVLHLHGEITRAQSTANPRLIYPIEGSELKMGDQCELGSQLRPFIVWFGEQVPMMDLASAWVEDADIFAVIGTSLQVYPAAGLVNHVPYETPVYLIDPGNPDVRPRENLHIIREPAGTGVEKLRHLLMLLRTDAIHRVS